MLEIKNLSKSYDGKTYAVKDLNLTVMPGEIRAFIGHNGAGKTTTLKAISGIIDFQEGEIFVDGKSVGENAFDVKKVIAYIPDNPEIYEHLKGIDYLNFVANIYKISSAERKELIEKYAKLFNLYDNLNDNVGTYSHGMKQKLAVISALIHKPKLLLLDEPFVGLDPRATFDFKSLLKDLTDAGVAVLYSTHVLEVAEKLATHVTIISKGKVVVDGTISDAIKNKSLEKLYLELQDNE